MGTRGKVQLGRDTDHSSAFSAKVKNEYELYLLSSWGLQWWWMDSFTFYFTLYKKEISVHLWILF
jgi:hypothetical protein